MQRLIKWAILVMALSAMPAQANPPAPASIPKPADIDAIQTELFWLKKSQELMSARTEAEKSKATLQSAAGGGALQAPDWQVVAIEGVGEALHATLRDAVTNETWVVAQRDRIGDVRVQSIGREGVRIADRDGRSRLIKPVRPVK